MRGITRRQLALGLVGATVGCAVEPEPPRGEIVVSAQGRHESQFALTGTAANGTIVSLNTGFRGHGLAVHPRRAGVVVMVARRPGTTLVMVDLATGRELVRSEAINGTHFFGHGVFSLDGRRLYTTEADVEAGEGLVGVRDADTLELVEHFPSYGVGPHELLLMPDGDTLVVANGGILTRPDTGREKLNLDTMAPSLSYIDRHGGALLEDVRLEESKASIRHLGVTADGAVALGVQLQREVAATTAPVALGAVHHRGGPLRPLEADGLVWRAFDDYVGSVAVDGRHDLVALTSPHGNLTGFWRMSDGSFAGQVDMPDVSGVTCTRDHHFALSNSLGEVRFIDAATLLEVPARGVSHPELSWDNHLSVVEVS